jgi:hypothetical protein
LHFERLPNPTEGEAFLLYEIGERQTAVVNVYDLTGKLVAVTPITSNTGVVTLNLNDLESGVYLFQVLSEGQLLSTGRIIRK